ncbi:DNA polymerase IV [candidate division TA06 bacterium]|uniref:DNA polymerase IV n=1 Tax=candidate division TA06 bacterium TaxID=2250710 RepID=A0A933ICE2_UNCT6|nr:DNA polymerase IV [candidate division TA06 bacterium]
MERLIAHVDMDCFYAAVEVLDDPGLLGRPVIVGSDPKGGKGRGVVSASSYAARKFGVHSAMPISQAFRLCPNGVFLPGRMGRYVEVSDQIMEILYGFTPQLQQISVDEAFLDMTGCRRIFGDPEQIGKRIKQAIRQKSGLSASVGLGSNKLIAKIASDLKKPDGLVVVPPGGEAEFLSPLPLRKLWGIGPKIEQRIRSRFKAETIGQLAAIPERSLAQEFAVMGEYLHQRANGVDDDPVCDERQAKSISRENTFDEDTADKEILLSTLLYLCDDAAGSLRNSQFEGRTITLKLRYSNFETHTYGRTYSRLPAAAGEIFKAAKALFLDNWRKGQAVRLLGVSVSNFEQKPEQMGLFTGDGANDRKAEKLEKAVDAVRKKLGKRSIVRGGTMER